jgi:hypothetical protein
MKIYKYDDIVTFHLDEIIKYRVNDNHISCIGPSSNDYIFKQLGVDRHSFCAQAYGYTAGGGDCPTYKLEDYEAASRLIEALYKECSKKQLEIAKERYPIGTKYRCPNNKIEYTVTHQSFSVFDDCKVYGQFGCGCLYYDGKWADITEMGKTDTKKSTLKYKVGDKVRFIKDFNGVDKNIIAIVQTITNSGTYYLSGWAGDFPEDVLELVDEVKQEAPKSIHKFQVGDQVKVKDWGIGCSRSDMDEIVQITEQGMYWDTPGYKVSPPIGNSKSGQHGGFIGEESFEKFDHDTPGFIYAPLNPLDFISVDDSVSKPTVSIDQISRWSTSGLLSTEGRVIGVVGRKIEAKPTDNKIKKVNFTRI